MRNTDIVLLLSGGLDSITLGEYALNSNVHVVALSFAYGQGAVTQEIIKAKRWCRKNDVRHEIRTIDLYLSGMDRPAGEAGPRIVPARNLIMLGIAANFAKSVGASQIWYGATAEDAEYPDCSSDFVRGVSDMLIASEGITVHAPFLEKTRSEIVTLAKQFNLSADDVWSCYRPSGGKKDKPCGSCNSCCQEAL